MCTQCQHRLVLATHNHSQRQELWPVARLLIVHGWQPKYAGPSKDKREKTFKELLWLKSYQWYVYFILFQKGFPPTHTVFTETHLFQCGVCITNRTLYTKKVIVSHCWTVVLLEVIVKDQCWFKWWIMACGWYISLWSLSPYLHNTTGSHRLLLTLLIGTFYPKYN